MIEAVNSTIANAALVRNVAEQATSARVQSPSPAQERREISVPRAPYVSPYIKVDVEFDTAVLQIRDSDTGDVIDQFPREQTLAARQRQEAQREVEVRRAEAQSIQSDSTTRAQTSAENSVQTAAPRQASSNVSSSTALQAQQSVTTTAELSNAQLASVAFTAGSQSDVSTSQGISFNA